MKKSVSMFTVALCAACAFADIAVQPSMIKIPGKGRIAFVDAADTNIRLVEAAAKKVGGQLMIEAVALKGKWSFATVQSDFAAAKSSVVVFIVKDKTLPLSLVALEGKWGLVNAAKFTDEGLSKELVRIASVVLGAAYSKYKASVLRPAFSAEEVEKNAGKIITIDTLMALQPSIESLGITQYSLKSYADALEDGDAPEPANDVQRKLKADFEKRRK